MTYDADFFILAVEDIIEFRDLPDPVFLAQGKKEVLADEAKSRDERGLVIDFVFLEFLYQVVEDHGRRGKSVQQDDHVGLFGIAGIA